MIRLLVAILFWDCLLMPACCQESVTTKAVWTLENGQQVRGTFAGFRSHWCWVSRRFGKLHVNRQEVREPASVAIVSKLGEHHGIPMDQPDVLEQQLAKVRPGPAPDEGRIYGLAEVGFRFYTVQLSSEAGVQEIPTAFIAAADRAILFPEFATWEQNLLQQERAERFRQQLLAQLDLQRGLIEETNRILRSIERAAWWIAMNE